MIEDIYVWDQYDYCDEPLDEDFEDDDDFDDDDFFDFDDDDDYEEDE